MYVRATDITKAIYQNGFCELKNYAQVIGVVIPPIENEADLTDLFNVLCHKINCQLTLINKPKSREDLVKLFKELEKQL